MAVSTAIASGSPIVLDNDPANGAAAQETTTVLSDGRLLVVWRDLTGGFGDLSGSAIVAKILNPDGSTSVSPFLVNTTTAGDQNYPSVAALPGGGFVVAWEDGTAPSGTTGNPVRFQSFSAGGVKSGAEKLIAGLSGVAQSEVATLANGDFVIGPDIFSPTGVLLAATGVGGAVLAQGDDFLTVSEILSFALLHTVVYALTAQTYDNSAVSVGTPQSLDTSVYFDAYALFADKTLLAVSSSTVATIYQTIDPPPGGYLTFNAIASGVITPLTTLPTASIASHITLAALGDEIAVSWIDSAGLHVGTISESGAFRNAVPVGAAMPSGVLDASLTAISPTRLLETYTDSAGQLNAQFFNVVTGDSPTISGTLFNQAIDDNVSLNPFSGVVIADPTASATLTVTVALSAAANGTLSNLGAGTYVASTGVYTVSGSAAAVTSALDALTFTPTLYQVTPNNAEVTHFTITADDGASPATVDAVTSVIATDRVYAPTISGTLANQSVATGETDTPFANVAIGYNPGSLYWLTATVRLSDPSHGALSNLTNGAYNASTGVYTVNGPGNWVTRALDALVFTPATGALSPGQSETTTFTIGVTDGQTPVVFDNSTTITAFGGSSSHSPASAGGDFTGDGKSDILWQADDGTVALWASTSSGAYAYDQLGAVDASWQEAGVGDFNGDGLADVLWRNTSGATVLWDANGAGGVSGVSVGTVDPSWRIAGVGDFNGDQKSDILWRNTDGTVALWASTPGGAYAYDVLGTVDSTWAVAGVGDFNGDGLADVLWRNASGAVALWEANGSGGVTGVSLGTVDSAWNIVGVGDFNGDHKSDILWRKSDGTMALWESTSTSAYAYDVLGTVDSTWAVAGVGDFNGDGLADILWRNSSGATALWEADGNGGVTGVTLGPVATNWQIKAA